MCEETLQRRRYCLSTVTFAAKICIKERIKDRFQWKYESLAFLLDVRVTLRTLIFVIRNKAATKPYRLLCNERGLQ